MKFSYNWIQSFLDEQLPQPQDLADLLIKHSFEVEGVENRNGDYILEVDILPNRAHDCLSHYGLARECASLLDVEYKALKSKERGESEEGVLSIDIQDSSLCPRYCAYVIEGVKITESPDWMKKRLESVEQKSINNVVDITNYIVWELGQPLHAFDLDKIKGEKMTIRTSKNGESVETLDGVDRELDGETIIIEDAERVIDLAGIKGGANTQIEDSTQKIIFQAAIFDPDRIRSASQKLGVRTDAAVRYMHGFDPELTGVALERAVELLKETNPDAKVVQKIDIYPNPATAKEVSLSMQYVNDLLGTQLAEDEVGDILKRLGFDYEVSDSNFQIHVPSHRLDIEIAEDLIEDIGRVYGYEKIEAKLPRGVLILPVRNDKIFYRSQMRKIMTGFGFSEVYNYSMISKAKDGDYEFPVIELANPISDEFQYLRPWLLQGVLKNIALNKKYFDSVKVFEIGKVFCKEGEDIREKENLILAMNSKKQEIDGFYEIKGYADEFLNKLGISDFYFDPTFLKDEEVAYGFFLHPAKRAIIRMNGDFAGFIGELHPRLAEEINLKGKTYCVEFNFDIVSDIAEEEHIYQKPSKYPEVVRDISLYVPAGTMVVDILNLINASAGSLLRDIDLFDIYEGENMPEGLKNTAFHLIFQSDDQTLTSQEVDVIMKRIQDDVEKEGWEVR